MSLPILHSQFFRRHHPEKEFWIKWGTASQWTAQLCPLYEWEEVLYVGSSSPTCETPQILQPKKIILLHCEEASLGLFFHSLQQLVSPAKIPGKSVSLPISSPHENIKTPMPSNLERERDPFASLNLSDDPAAATASDPDFFETLETEAPKETSDLAETAISEMPEGLDLDISSPLPVPSANLQNTTTSNLAGVYPPESEQLGRKILGEMSSHFNKAMLLKREGNALIPWILDENFSRHDKADRNPISLGKPSPFRIVAKTLKPYHGYVAPNEISEKFFEDWNSSEIPGHLTVMPITLNDQLVAVLLGLAGSEINQKASLLLVERLAAEMQKLAQSLGANKLAS